MKPASVERSTLNAQRSTFNSFGWFMGPIRANVGVRASHEPRSRKAGRKTIGKTIRARP
jgi:hypothetical protein